jgi:valyl-tRNA synthetase
MSSIPLLMMARSTTNANFAPIVGLDRFEARKRMKGFLEESESLVKIEDYKTNIGRSERTNSVVEPKLSLQWFVKMADLGAPALKSGDRGGSEILPAQFPESVPELDGKPPGLVHFPPTLVGATHSRPGT